MSKTDISNKLCYECALHLEEEEWNIAGDHFMIKGKKYYPIKPTMYDKETINAADWKLDFASNDNYAILINKEFYFISIRKFVKLVTENSMLYTIMIPIWEIIKWHDKSIFN